MQARPTTDQILRDLAREVREELIPAVDDPALQVNLEMMEQLLAAGAKVEQQHSLGTTALHYAALGGQLETVAFLLDAGADPGRIGKKFDFSGHTPRQLAEGRGHTEVVNLLRQQGG